MNHKNIVLIYPHQLFEKNEVIENLINSKVDFCVYLIEDYLFFRQYTFHKQKLVLHRASMKFYESYLKQKYTGINVLYIESSELKERKDFWHILQTVHKNNKVNRIYIYELVDYYLEQDVKKFVTENDIELNVHTSPLFITSHKDNVYFFHTQNKGKRPFMKTYYEWQRKKLNILMDKSGKPLGGKFSFDTENRKKLPKGYSEPERITFAENRFVSEAKQYVQTFFDGNYGDLTHFNYAIDFQSARKVLDAFLIHKLKDFGIYEDSISGSFDFLNHSILSPYLNIGLLTPAEVVEETITFAHSTPAKAPINSLEGFLRQIIGWREFMRAMYEIYGVKMRAKNFWQHQKKLPSSFWSANTGNMVVDTTIKKTLAHAYNHHIERLMILGNYMLLSEIHPDDVYKWFMEMYIDAYDWVMVPNVYGMSQFADGGIFATKPYICASNYICKMSDYKKDGIWEKDFDENFWNFLKKHKPFFSTNIRFKMLLNRIKD
jgi:deoxyribodipyrimidine photolyase-related protein